MAKRYFDAIGGIKLALQEFKEKELLIWSAITTIVMGVCSIFDILLGLAIVWIIAMMLNTTFEEMTEANIRLNLGIFSALAGIYLVPRVMRAAMGALKVKTAPNPPKYLDWLTLNVRKFFIDLFCWYDKKLLVPAVVFLVIGIGVLVAAVVMGANDISNLSETSVLVLIAGIAVVLIGIFCWSIADVVHSLRTQFGLFMYLRGDGEEGKMLKKSAQLVQGQTLEVFLAHLIFGLMLFIVMVPLVIVMVLLALIPCLGIVIDSVLALVLAIILMAISNHYNANVFKFFCEGVSAKPEAAKASGSKPAKKRK